MADYSNDGAAPNLSVSYFEHRMCVCMQVCVSFKGTVEINRNEMKSSRSQWQALFGVSFVHHGKLRILFS